MSVLRLLLFNIFTNDLHGPMECTFTKLMDYINLGGSSVCWSVQLPFRGDLNRLEK